MFVCLLLCLFVVYLTMLSTAPTIRQMMGSLMNNELERIWMEAVVT
jgi:hypothetical protein